MFLFLCSVKVELASDEIGYLAEISKQSIQGVAWLLLTAYRTDDGTVMQKGMRI